MDLIFDYINIDENLKNRVCTLYSKSSAKINTLADNCFGKGFGILNSYDDLTRLAVILQCAEAAKEKYDALGINGKIFADTMSDINIWCENNGNKGLKNSNWLKNHVSFELFKIGRLQYQFFRCTVKRLNYRHLPLNYGDNVIYVHIPQGEKLIYSECVNSLKDAVVFFEKYFPQYHYDFFFSESWLLYGENWRFMEPSSNILQFASLFDIAYSYPVDAQAVERIFGKRKLLKKNYPENTSLQKSAKKFMLDGGKLGAGIGIIAKSFFI